MWKAEEGGDNEDVSYGGEASHTTNPRHRNAFSSFWRPHKAPELPNGIPQLVQEKESLFF